VQPDRLPVLMCSGIYILLGASSEMARRRETQGLYYITHINDLPSILDRGILCHERIEAEGIPFEPIYDRDIVASRRQRDVPDGRSLWKFANLFFQPRNPMLFRVALVEDRLEQIAVLGLGPNILDELDLFVSLGNAASPQSDIVPAAAARKSMPEILRWADNEFWTREVYASTDAPRGRHVLLEDADTNCQRQHSAGNGKGSCFESKVSVP